MNAALALASGIALVLAIFGAGSAYMARAVGWREIGITWCLTLSVTAVLLLASVLIAYGIGAPP